VNHYSLFRLPGAVLCLFSLPLVAQAADPNYQAYFFSVCPGATGALAARCAQTPGGLGDLSGDSESSLNPSQTLNTGLLGVGLGRVRETGGSAEQADGAAGSVPATTTRVDVGPWSFLMQARWSSFEREKSVGVDRERGIDGDQWALEAGVERRLSDKVVVGAIASYEKSSSDFVAERPGVNFTPAASAGSIDADGYGIALYLSRTVGSSGYVEASIGRDSRSFDLTRNVVFQESTRTAAQTNVRTAGDTDGDSTWASVGAGNDWTWGARSLGIYGSLSYEDASFDEYSERDLSSSGLALRYLKYERDSTLGTLGVRASYTASRASGVLVPYAKLEYIARLERKAPTSQSALLLDPAQRVLTLTGDKPDQGAVNVGVGLSGVSPGGLSWFAAVEAVVSGDLQRERVLLGLRKEF
jgi:outer membrane autotransporter protein